MLNKSRFLIVFRSGEVIDKTLIYRKNSRDKIIYRYTIFDIECVKRNPKDWAKTKWKNFKEIIDYSKDGWGLDGSIETYNLDTLLTMAEVTS